MGKARSVHLAWGPLGRTPAAEICDLLGEYNQSLVGSDGSGGGVNGGGAVARGEAEHGGGGRRVMGALARRGEVGVVLAMVDTVSGLLWPPVVAAGEETQKAWEQMFQRGQKAGLAVGRLRGVAGDQGRGTPELSSARQLRWVRQQRCLWHIRHNLHSKVKAAAAEAAPGLVAEAARAGSARGDANAECHESTPCWRPRPTLKRKRRWQRCRGTLSAKSSHSSSTSSLTRCWSTPSITIKTWPRSIPEWLWHNFPPPP